MSRRKSKKINVRQHPRRTPSGGKTMVSQHTRRIQPSKPKKAAEPHIILREVPIWVIDTAKELAEKLEAEHAIGLDYEDLSPTACKECGLESISIDAGTDGYVYKLEGDYEIHIHTHPKDLIAYPSDFDLASLEYGQAQIIVSNFANAELYKIPSHDVCFYYIHDNTLFEQMTRRKPHWSNEVFNNAANASLEQLRKRYPTILIDKTYDHEHKIYVPFIPKSEPHHIKDYHFLLRKNLKRMVSSYGITIEVPNHEPPYFLPARFDDDPNL